MSLKKISTLFNFEKGVLQSSKCTPGDYNFITASSDWKTHNEFTHDCEALIFAAAASGSLGRTHYVNGKFVSSDLCFIITPKDPENLPIDLKFYHLIFQAFRDEIVRNTKAGTSKEAIGLKAFGNYKLPYFDIAQQISTKEKFVNAQLSTLALDNELSHQLYIVKQLRQAFLREAMQGKLVEQNEADEPATELLAKIKAEKEQLIKEGKIKKQKPLPPISEDEIPFEIPENWVWCKIDSLVYDISKDIRTGPFGTALNKSEHKQEGIPVWGIESISKSGVFTNKNKIFVTEEKARELKSFEVFGGDLIISRSGTIAELCMIPLETQKGLLSTNLMKISLDNRIMLPEIFCHIIKGSSYIVESLVDLCSGSTRLFLTQKILKSLIFPLPPLSEQKRIVAKLDELMAYCDNLEESIKKSQKQNEMLLGQVLKEALEPVQKSIKEEVL